MNRLLRQLEVDAPVFGECAEADLQTLDETCTTWEHDDGQREITTWIIGRSALDAARELTEFARTNNDPSARQFAFVILFALDTAAEPVMRGTDALVELPDDLDPKLAEFLAFDGRARASRVGGDEATEP